MHYIWCDDDNYLSDYYNFDRASKKIDYATLEYITKFEPAGLNNLDYLSLISKNFIIYIALIFIVAIVYYLVSLVIKQQTYFSKALIISRVAIIPYIVR